MEAYEYTTSNQFMTIADVPCLSVSGIIDSQMNHYMGNLINDAEEYNHALKITTSEINKVIENNGNVIDASDRKWFSVQNNTFDEENWSDAN